MEINLFIIIFFITKNLNIQIFYEYLAELIINRLLITNYNFYI